jgi:hypothetical protein
MSKNINVNPGNYKVAGRERQGEDVVHDLEARKMTQAAPRNKTAARGKPKTARKKK